MGSNMITQIIGGAILVIVAFALWPTLNSSTNALWSFFRDSCDDGNGNRFTRVYIGDERPASTALPSTLVANAYYVNHGVHGGKGTPLANSSNSCSPNAAIAATGIKESDGTTDFSGTDNVKLYDEAGDLLGTKALSSGSLAATTTLDSPYHWVLTAPMLKRFGGINNLLLTIIPVVSIAGMLGIGVARLYAMGRSGGGDIGSVISKSLFAMIGIVIAMVLAGPIMDSMVDANTVVVSGQYQVNSQFNGILGLLFGMMPIVYIASLVTVVGLQAKAALSGASGGRGM